MSENEQELAADEKQSEEVEDKVEAEVKVEENTAPASVKKGSAGIMLVIILSLAWYLAADRFTRPIHSLHPAGTCTGLCHRCCPQGWRRSYQRMGQER